MSSQIEIINTNFDSLAKRVKFIRESTGLSQQKFADLIQTSQGTINKKQFDLIDRRITLFDINAYSVNYKNNPGQTLYYLSDGSLVRIDFIVVNNSVVKSYKHSYPDGNLSSITLHVSKDNSYIFKQNGALLAHWVKDKCFDVDGKIVITRKQFK